MIIQQVLCFAAVQELCEPFGLTVRSKNVFAGDSQSGQAGDIRVFTKDVLVAAIEVKAHSISSEKIIEVLESHGVHTYPLMIVANEILERKSSKQLSYATVIDFIETITTLCAIHSSGQLEEAAQHVLERYNHAIVNTENRPEYSVVFKV